MSYLVRLAMAKAVILRMRLRRRHLSRLSRYPNIATRTPKRSFRFAAVVLALLLLTLPTNLERLHIITVESVTSSQTRLQPPIGTLHGDLSAVPEDAVSAGDEQIGQMQQQVRQLEQALQLANEEGASLKSLLGLSRSRIDDLQQFTFALNRDVQRLTDEKAILERELAERNQALADAEDRWQSENTETRVIYNITNIPVGGHVTLANEPNVAEIQQQSAVDGPERVAAPTERQEVPDTSVLGAQETRASKLAVDDALDRQNVVSVPLSDGTVMQEPFFGPAPDRYEDRVSPAMEGSLIDSTE